MAAEDPFGVLVKGSVKQWSEELVDKVSDAVEGNMLQAAEFAAGAVRNEIFTGAFRPGTGSLARSYTATLLAPKEGKLRSGALSDLVYARIQDEGGTITPKNAKALAVPVTNNARQLSARGIGPKDFPTPLSLVWPKGRDRGFLIDKTKQVHYSLRKSVRIPGRGYLKEAAKAAEPKLAELFDDKIGVAAGEAEAGGEK